MKKILRAVLGLTACAAVLSGCSRKDTPATQVSFLRQPEIVSPGEQAVAEKRIPKEKIKIGVIHLTDPAEGVGYTYAHDLGIQAMQENLDLYNKQIIRKNNIDDRDAKTVEKAMTECIEKGCNIIFATSEGYGSVTEKMAKEYPEVCFFQVGGTKKGTRNFNHYFGRIYEARYLSGIAAGLKTETNRIGYVAAFGRENAEVTSGLDAFALGVYSVNENARIYVEITGGWFVPEEETKKTQELIAAGCDVIAQHCNTANPQLAAQEAGVYSIGCHSDMSISAPKAVLVSVLWNWSAYYTQTVEGLIKGHWKREDYLGGLREGVTGLSAMSDFNAPQAEEKIREAFGKIAEGSFPIFAGKLETNEGTFVGREGYIFSEKEITEEIHWYFKNIEQQ